MWLRTERKPANWQVDMRCDEVSGGPRATVQYAARK